MKKLQIKRADGSVYVYLGEDLICELRKERFLRFRASGKTDNWIGSEKSPADLSIAYSEQGTKGCEVRAVNIMCDAENGTFSIEVDAVKPKLSRKNAVHYSLYGRYDAKKCGMQYELTETMTANVQEWYRLSDWARPYSRKYPNTEAPIQMMDYRIEQVSHTEINAAEHKRDGKVRYPWFFSTEDGVHYEKWPKVHVPYTTMRGNYCTVRVADRLHKGASYGYADATYGGWKETILATSHPVSHEVCWAVFDVHIILPHAVPIKTMSGDFTVSLKLGFEPLSPEECKNLIANAQERNWRAEPVYQLPLLTGNDTFDRLISDVPSEETAEHALYWASDANCFRDDQIGYDDHYSLSIKRTENTPKPSAWIGSFFVRNFDHQSREGRRVRLTAMLKTEKCTGKVRVGYMEEKRGGTIFYGFDTHRADGTPRMDYLDFIYSEAVRGTQDFTPISVEVPCAKDSGAFFIEMSGCGQCWIDNVQTEILGLADPIIKLTEDFSANEPHMCGWSCTGYDKATLTDENVVLDKTIGASIVRRNGALVLSSGGRKVKETLSVCRALPNGFTNYTASVVFVRKCTGIVSVAWAGAPAVVFTEHEVMFRLPCGTLQPLLSGLQNEQPITVHVENKYHTVTYTVTTNGQTGTATTSYEAVDKSNEFRVTMQKNARGCVKIYSHHFEITE